MAVRFQLRRDTAANWAASNPTLALGEPGVETDTLKVKVGDGDTAWNSLAYSITKDFTDLTSKPTTVSGYGITDALTLTALSVTQNAANGTGALTYNNTTGVFEYTPPNFQDLDGNFTGSVFADNSTVMVDGVSATLNFVNNDTDDLAEGSTNQYFTTTRARAAISAGTGITITDGEIATTITQYTDTDAQAAITGGTGVTVTSGEVAIGQAVGTTDDVTFNSVTGNVFTSLIDSADSSAITITPDLVLSAGLTVGNHIVPSSNSNIDLGSEANRFRDLYLSGNSAIIGDLALKRHTSGGLLVSDHSTGDPTNITTHNITANDITAAGNVDVTGNLTMTGYIAGPASFVIDPAAVGDNTGTVVIAGDLQVDGTTTTINSTTLEVDDKNIVLSSGSPNSAGSDGAGITVDNGSDTDATILYDGINDKWEINKDLDVTGNIIVSGTVDGRDVATDGTKLDGIEASADVTDTANVTAAGALMDSELTDEAAVKALNQGVATTDAVTFAGVSTDEFDLSAIDASIADTAVDIFIYDTSKDSDGGAWRKRTQHTSWYNETLNTATRGSRREFPAVAVIVAESTQLTIYDGDDPDMPMWMIQTGFGTTLQSIGMLNAELVIGDNIRMALANFISEKVYYLENAYAYYSGQGETVVSGNTLGSQISVDSNNSQRLAGQSVNDVAMTVLPNAPIDSATGLPIPTIAVATDGGVSVIKDDGTVVDYTYSSTNNNTRYVTFTDSGLFYLARSYSSDANFYGYHYLSIASSDVSTKPDRFYSYQENVNQFQITSPVGGITTPLKNVVNANGEITIGTTSFSDNPGNGIYKILETGEFRKELINHTTTSYNTGWMNGDIKLATLSDTDATDLVGGQKITNGTFDTDTTGWTAGNGASLSVSSGQLVIAVGGSYSYAVQSVSLDPGTYRFSAEMPGGNTTGRVRIGTNAFGTQFINGTILGAGSYHYYTFTVATTTTVYFTLLCQSTTNGQFTKWDNVSCAIQEEDRSVNNNGLQVFGTVTKNPVATGADLVKYGGFSASNYLEQPYNSDLDFGTGDFCVIGWWLPSGTTNVGSFFNRESSSGNPAFALRRKFGRLYFKCSATGSETDTGVQFAPAGVPVFICMRRLSGNLAIFIDGASVYTASNSSDISDTTNSPVFRIGYSFLDSEASQFPAALIRASATAPSDEQIKKIYEDEKFLYQENAQATLYGSSDSVTALAYDDDTELLHVGTSAGRSVFQGLRRVDNTTDAVGSAISASNGMVAED